MSELECWISSLHWTILVLFCVFFVKESLIRPDILHCTKTNKMREKYSNGDYSSFFVYSSLFYDSFFIYLPLCFMDPLLFICLCVIMFPFVCHDFPRACLIDWTRVWILWICLKRKSNCQRKECLFPHTVCYFYKFCA